MDFSSIKSVGQTFTSRPKIPPTKYYQNLYDPENKEALDYLLNERKLTTDTINKFVIGVNERGDIAIPVLKDKELIDYKYRGVKEKRFTRHPGSETWAINEEAFGICEQKGYIVITEGEFDCMAVWQMGHELKIEIPVISGTGGAQGKMDWIERIPEEGVKVYINYDNDKPGQEAALKLADRLGIERCFNVILPTKDANDFIKAGHKGEEFLKLMKDAKHFDIPGVSKVVDAIEELRANPIQRIPTHLSRFNIHTKGGIVKHGLITIAAKPGVGKSSLMLNFLIKHANDGIPVLLISLENDMMLTIQRILETWYKRPIKDFSDNMWEQAKIDLVNYPFYVEMAKNVTTIAKLRKVVLQAKKLYGVEIVGYDHVGMITSDKDKLPEVVKNIYEIKNEAGVTMYIISHVRKGDRGQKFIDGDDLYGTAAFHQLSNMLLLLQNFGSGMELTIEKARESSSHLRIPILFNGETGEITDDMGRKVKYFDNELEDVEQINPFIVPTTIDEAPTTPAGTPDYEY